MPGLSTGIALSLIHIWMMLFIDIDRNKSTGWEGYDYVVNYETPDASTGTVSKNVGGKCEWDKAGDFDYVVKGNKMAIRCV